MALPEDRHPRQVDHLPQVREQTPSRKWILQMSPRQHDIAPQKQEPEKVMQSPAKHTPETRFKSKARAQPTPSPETVSALTDAREEPTEKAIPTPASILQDLVSEGIIDDIANLNFLKLPSLSSRHQEISSDLLNAIPKLTITPEDQAALLAGKLVRKNVDGPNRILLTPNGDCIRNLTQDEGRSIPCSASQHRRGIRPGCLLLCKASHGEWLCTGRRPGRSQWTTSLLSPVRR